jgi:hypothetical protein
MFGVINWKTTLCGFITIVAAGMSADPKFAPYTTIIGMVAAGVTGLVAKDNNVTGGQISNVTGKTALVATSRVDLGETK